MRHQEAGRRVVAGGDRAAGLGSRPAAPVAAEDPGPAAYEQALKGKRVMLVPMAMGFDLAQGWAALSQASEVEGLRRHLRDARPELERRGRRPGDHRGDLLRSEAGRADRPFARPQLLLEALQEGAGSRHLRHPDRQSRQLRRRRLRRQRLGPARPARGRSRRQGLRRELVEEDRPRPGRPGQRLEPLPICRHHEGAGEASGLPGGGQAGLRTGTRRRRATSRTTMLQQNPDICGIIDFWDGDATGTVRRDPRRRQARARSSWSPPAAARRSIATICSPAPSARW